MVFSRPYGRIGLGIFALLLLCVWPLCNPARAMGGEVDCPVGLDAIRDLPRVESILFSPANVVENNDAGSAEKTARQLEVLAGMSEVPHIALVVCHLSLEKIAIGRADLAASVVVEGWRHALYMFGESRSLNVAGEVLDLIDLLDLKHLHVGFVTARDGLTALVKASEAKDPFTRGFAITEAGHALARWGHMDLAVGWFERARSHALTSPIHVGDGEAPRFQLLIHVAQRAWQSNFQTLARKTLEEAERVREKDHPGRRDLEVSSRILFREFMR